MARFTHPAIVDSGIGTPGGDAWNIQGGTTGVGAVQPTFSGTPLFSGEYAIVGPLCHFSIDVDFSNILTFGTGQYYMTLPFAAKHNYSLSDGRLFDSSKSGYYIITGDVAEGSNVMKLFSISSNGETVAFQDGIPVNLQSVDSFRIAGTYQITD